MDIQAVQAALVQAGIRGWLLYDFRRSNDIACRLLDLPSEQLLTRRFCYWIPAQGTPVKLVHRIEAGILDHMPGRTVPYHSWQSFEKHLQQCVDGVQSVAMEYSPNNSIPTVSRVDAGTVELVRSFGVQVVSSADLIQAFLCVWDEEKTQLHWQAAEVVDRTVSEAWEYIEGALREETQVSDYEVQQFILRRFAEADCVTESPPICALNADSADPHFSPNPHEPRWIQRGDFILIDLWCKRKVPRATYADITRVGVAAPTATHRQQEIFHYVKDARDKAFSLVQERLDEGKEVRGWEVDEVARKCIAAAGYGDHFIHRLGHNIDESDHGDGANLDNLETRDERLLLPGTCFSIEPGIYLPGEFGVRLEYDVFIDPQGRPHITGGIQNQIRTLVL